MAVRRPIRLPRQWSQHVKSGVLHAISLASVAVAYARGYAASRRRLHARLEQAETEIALLKEELGIKDRRWERSRTRLLARAGLSLGATTIRRMVRENEGSPEDDPEVTIRRRRRVVARYPGHTFHVDLTTVPTRAGFRVPWFPFSLPQRWPFCWWVAVVVDQVSRSLMGFAVFRQLPSSDEIQRFLDRAVQAAGTAPKYIVTDKGKQFWCRGFKRWCKGRGIRPRYGAIGEPASIAIVERFIRSMKQECTRLLLVPLSLAAMRRELRLYATWFNTQRPHTALSGRTPREVYAGRTRRRRRIEPRPRWPHGPGRRRARGDKVRLEVSYVKGRKHLPVIDLRRAA